MREAFGEGLDGRFRGVVGRVSWWIGDSLLGTGDNDGVWIAVLLKEWEEGADSAKDAV